MGESWIVWVGILAIIAFCIALMSGGGKREIRDMTGTSGASTYLTTNVSEIRSAPQIGGKRRRRRKK